MRNRFLIITCLFIFFFHPSQGKEDYKFRTMSPAGGFYFDGVKGIEQDQEGFIWIVMDDELYRFDGFQYKKFYPYFASINQTKKWLFHNITSDSRGNLFVNTSNGIYLYNSQTDSFNRIYDKVATLKTDKADNLWVWANGIWSILDIRNGKLTTPLFDGKTVSAVRPAFCMHNDDLYLFHDNTIYRFNYTKNEFTSCSALPHKDGNIQFAKAHQGKLWLFVGKYGLYKIDLSTFNIEEVFDFVPEENNSLRSFYIDKKGYIWFGTIKGLYILDPKTHKLSHYTHSEKDPFSLPNNSVWSINEDRQQNVWLGTYSGAICYININESNAFKTYTPKNSHLNLTPVSTFAEGEKYLWIGTEGGGKTVSTKKVGNSVTLQTKTVSTPTISKH